MRLLKDASYINERDVKVMNNQNGTSWKPLYTIEDVNSLESHIIEKPIGEKIKIDEEISFQFIPSGHLYNSCQIYLWITVDNVTKTICYTGDIGNPLVDNKYVGKLEKIDKCMCVIGECTYGDRKDLKVRTKQRNDDISKLKTIIDNQVVENKGRLLIPSFAQNRSVVMANMIYNLYKDDDNFKNKIYIDSPLAIDLLNILHTELEAEELEDFDDMLNWKNLVLCKDPMDSKELTDSDEACIIIATSAFCNHGRVVHHLKKTVTNPNATILFCGYASPQSLGGILRDPKTKSITIDGKSYIVRCACFSLKSMSGHAMFETLLDYYSNINCENIILHHGSENAKIEFSKELKKEFAKKCKTTKVICANSSLRLTI